MNQWIPTGKYGLRYREHEARTKGVGRYERSLRYFVAVYKWKKKTVTDIYGWEGDDFRNEDDIVATALELRQNRRDMKPPFTLKERNELRAMAIEEKDKAEQEKLARQERENQIVFKNMFDRYCEANSHKKSLKDEISLFKFWIGPAIGEKKLDEILLLDLERFKRHMEKKRKSPRTIQYTKAVIRQVYRFAINRKLYAGEIPTVHFLEKYRFDNKRMRYLDPDEARVLLDEVRKHSETTYRIALLSLNTGMRFGEIASLLWQNINPRMREILVIDPKNSETRSVFMTDTILQMFQTMERGSQNFLVFPSRNGKRMTLISKVFDRAVLKLGLNEGITDRRMRVVFHSLRHSCASWLVNSGVTIPIIARILGHKSLAMTMRYSHVNDTSVRSAMEHIDKKQNVQSASKVQVC